MMFNTRFAVGGGQRRGMATLVRKALEEKMTMLPAKNALRVKQDLRWTYQGLWEHTCSVANGLLSAGVKPGETVGVALPNSVEHVALQMGAGTAGIRVADAPVAEKGLTSKGLKKMLKDQKVKVLVVSPEQIPVLYETIPELESILKSSAKPLDLKDFPELKIVCHTGKSQENGTYRFSDLLAYYCVPEPLEEVKVEDGPFLVSIDPETGKKSEEASQKDIVKASKSKSSELSLSPDSRVMFGAQKNVASNLAVASMACVLSGAQLVLASEKYDAEAIKESNKLENCDATIQ